MFSHCKHTRYSPVYTTQSPRARHNHCTHTHEANSPRTSHSYIASHRWGGVVIQIVITPSTERHFAQFAAAMGGGGEGGASEWHGSILNSRLSECGRVTTAKGFSHLCGKYFLALPCEPTHSVSAIGRILTGLSKVRVTRLYCHNH
jgi:hypothetical protein